MLFVNFKTYEKGSGTDAINLVAMLESVSKDTQIKIVACVQTSDIKEVSLSSALEIWAQHIDPVEFGSHTGSILAEAVYEDGAVGTLLNHSEKRFADYNDLEVAHKRAKEAGLKTLIFAKDLNDLRTVIKFRPDFVSYEPPELVGSKTTSVAISKKEVVKDAVEIANSIGIPLIVGAGIKSSEDVRVSVELGASGVLVASDIVAANNPIKELKDIIEGF